MAVLRVAESSGYLHGALVMHKCACCCILAPLQVSCNSTNVSFVLVWAAAYVFPIQMFLSIIYEIHEEPVRCTITELAITLSNINAATAVLVFVRSRTSVHNHDVFPIPVVRERPVNGVNT